ncbi:MAG: helix-turn-helix domain-containing protein [Candidatus Bipolaricaulaceae bacterium]
MAKQTFGTLIRRARLEQRVPLRELARRVELAPSRLYRIESGERPPPSLPVIRALAQALNLPMGELLVATGTPREVLESLLWSERAAFPEGQRFAPHYPRLWARNTFLAEVVGGEGALRRVRVGECTWEVVAFGPARRLLITVPPEAVLLAPLALPLRGMSTTNVLTGAVCKARRVGELVNVVLAGEGVELNALIPAMWREGGGWERGAPLRAAFPVPAVRTQPLTKGEE